MPVAAGAAVDLVGSTLTAGVFLVVARAWVFSSSDGTHAFNELRFYGASALFGTLWSILGGFVGARLAQREHLLNGLLTAVPCALLGLALFAMGASGVLAPTWALVVVGDLLAVCGGAIGGALARRLQH